MSGIISLNVAGTGLLHTIQSLRFPNFAFAHLTSLDLTRNIDCSGLAPFRNLSGLTSLNLASTAIDDQTFASLFGTVPMFFLQKLVLSATNVVNCFHSPIILASLAGLKVLDLSRSMVTDESTKQLLQNTTQLHSLSLAYTSISELSFTPKLFAPLAFVNLQGTLFFIT